jgi:F-type H+-transporting ATPase subunit beta
MVTTAEKTNVGFITRIIGPVVDVKFTSGQLPEIYNALTITGHQPCGKQTVSVTCEVQQLLGDSQVRAVSMSHRWFGAGHGSHVDSGSTH